MDNLTQLFVEAGTLMLAGMVFVFAFLGMLIIFINKVLVNLAIKYPDPVVQSKPQRKTNKTKVDKGGISSPVVAAISSAVSQYRKQHSTNK
ncbi:MAG: OadG family protein [Colwelliaceae bacterium]|nr:OadG family protein [Colwelliaceae bacterium]